MTVRPWRLVALALALAVSAAAAQAPPAGDGWPIFRGNPLQTGVATGPLAEVLDVRWKFDAGDAIEGTAAIAGDTVYVGSMDEHLYALDRATGKVRWKLKGAPFKAPVSARGGTVYAGDVDGVFRAVDAATGKVRWDFKTNGEIASGANFAGDNVLFGSDDGNLYCLSPGGKLVWKLTTQDRVNGSPAVTGERTFVAGCDSSLHVIDTAAGKEIKAVELGGPIGATAAVDGDHAYVGTMSNQVVGVDWKKGEVVWNFEPEKRAQPFYASAAVTDKLVLVGGRDKKVYALGKKTGKEVWNFLTDGRVDSSPVVVGQRVFVGSQDGSLYVLDLAKGTLVKKFDLGSGVTASPAVAGGVLVIGTHKGAVYCLGGK